MTILYPYRDDGDDGYSLRYSIRSMCMHGDIYGCLLIGDRPSWYKGDYIPAKDIQGRKEWSIVSKVCMAPDGNYLYCHDDHFALMPFDKPFYHCGLLSKTNKTGLYAGRVAACISVYPYGMMYDCHTPMFIDIIKYKIAHAKCDWGARDYLSKSIYGNFVGGGEYIEDFKVRTILDKIPEGRPFFSTNDIMEKKVNLHELYPNASPYELV